MNIRDTAFLAALLYAVNPVKAQHVAQHIAVAAHDLPRGTILSTSDILWTTDSMNLTSQSFTRGFIKAKAAVVAPGWVARRNIRAGEPLSEPGVARPDLIVTGDQVDVVYHDDSVNIKLRGTAVGSGAQGDHIYVKLDNRRRLRGVVESANTVRVL